MVWLWLKKLNCFKKSESECDLFSAQNDPISCEDNSIDVEQINNESCDESIINIDNEENVESSVANISFSVANSSKINGHENIYASSPSNGYQQNLPPSETEPCSSRKCCYSSDVVQSYYNDKKETDNLGSFDGTHNINAIYTQNHENLIAKNLSEIYNVATINCNLNEIEENDVPSTEGSELYSVSKSSNYYPNFTFHLNSAPHYTSNNNSVGYNKRAANLFIKSLSECISATKEYYDSQGCKIFLKNGTVSKKNISAKKFVLISTCEILWKKEIRTWQTKIHLKPMQQNCNKPNLICTITNCGEKSLDLIARNFDLSKINGNKFDAILYPNYKQLEYAVTGIKAIRDNEDMLKKLWIGVETTENPKFHILKSSEDEISKMFHLAVNKVRPTLICSQTNLDAETIILKLKENFPQQVENGLIIRLITLSPPNLNDELKNCTKTLSEIRSLHKIIICTLGIAPKLVAEYGITNDYFENIFIINAQKSSEIDCWMVFGMLANIKTKIFLCGYANDNNKNVLTDFKVPQENAMSMFTRLCQRCHISDQNDNKEKIVIEL